MGELVAPGRPWSLLDDIRTSSNTTGSSGMVIGVLCFVMLLWKTITSLRSSFYSSERSSLPPNTKVILHHISLGSTSMTSAMPFKRSHSNPCGDYQNNRCWNPSRQNGQGIRHRSPREIRGKSVICRTATGHLLTACRTTKGSPFMARSARTGRKLVAKFTKNVSGLNIHRC
jgi:hypothetical protein